jgi:hypothetical protein
MLESTWGLASALSKITPQPLTFDFKDTVFYCAAASGHLVVLVLPMSQHDHAAATIGL